VYAREVNGKTLTFGVSGLLWEDGLVMVDSETGSLWSQILGQAMRGSLEGETLELIPATITEWGAWKSRYPRSTVAVMRPTAGHYARGFLDKDGGLVIGLADQKQARQWGFALLDLNPVVNDRFGDRAVLVSYGKVSLTAVIFDRNLDGRELSFEERGSVVIDRETQSEWDRLTGVATQGPLKGKRLSQLPGIVSDSAAWHTFHPLTTTWRPKDK
jgi:hypothetical protein